MFSIESLPIWTVPIPVEGRSALPTRIAVGTVGVATEALPQNIRRLRSGFQETFHAPETRDSPFQVEQIELNMAVDGSGSVELIGDLETAAPSSIKITLKRVPRQLSPAQ